MARRGYIPTTQEIEGIYERAINGDQSAEVEIGQLNRTLAARANTRLRELESKGLEGTSAYNIAKYWLSTESGYGGEYFKQNKVVSEKFGVDDMIENIDKAAAFLRSQTSSAAGEIKRRKNIIDKLDDRSFFDDLTDDRYSKDEIKKRLLDMFDTDAWSDIRKNAKGGTNAVVLEAIEAIQNGALLGDLKRAFKDFQRGADTDYIELWDNWTSANMYYQKGAWHELKSERR